MVGKKNFIWNTAGSLIVALSNAIILMFCTRINTTEIAGIFSISYATAYIFNTIGDFGIRIFQVSDTKRKYIFSEYLGARIIAIILMVILGTVFILLDGYRNEKFAVAFILILYRIIENLSESTQAEFQLNDRLDMAGKSMLIRTIPALAVCLCLDIITKNFIISLLGMLIINLTLFMLYDVRNVKKFTNINFKIDKKDVKEILIECLPLAISTLISIYVINSVKYAIDKSGNYTMQTYYNIIYMPTFAINLICIFVSKPFLKPFGEYWNSKEYNKLFATIFKIIGILVIMTILIEVACYLVGIPVLEMLYGVKLKEYKIDLILLVFSGLLYAISTIIFNALGAMRKQKYTIIPYAISAVYALIVPKFLVKQSGMRGAVASSIEVMAILCVTMLITLLVNILKVKKLKNV